MHKNIIFIEIKGFCYLWSPIICELSMSTYKPTLPLSKAEREGWPPHKAVKEKDYYDCILHSWGV